MGGGLGAMMWGAVGGMGTTLIRGADNMGGIGVRTCPGEMRTTGGLGITGTADRSVVRTGGAIEEGRRGTEVIGGLGLGILAAEEGIGGW